MMIWQNNFLITPLRRDHDSAFQNLCSRINFALQFRNEGKAWKNTKAYAARHAPHRPRSERFKL
jgi:hypothetical protein